MGGQDRHPDTVRRDIDAALGRAYTLQSLYKNFGAWGIRSRPGTTSIFPSDHRAGAAISGWTAWGRL